MTFTESRIPFKHRLRWWWRDVKNQLPWRMNEGEATARIVESLFNGYPSPAQFESKEQAVALLEAIWDVLDDWDGGRRNVARVQSGRWNGQRFVAQFDGGDPRGGAQGA